MPQAQAPRLPEWLVQVGEPTTLRVPPEGRPRPLSTKPSLGILAICGDHGFANLAVEDDLEGLSYSSRARGERRERTKRTPGGAVVLLLRPGRQRWTLGGMAVSDEVRQVEREIDDRIRALPLWRCGRERVVRAALDYYRDASEILMLQLARAQFMADDKIGHRVLLLENRMRAGVLYVLKWALAFCPEQSAEAFDVETIHSTQELGGHYEVLVDALRLAEHGLVDIEVDCEARRFTVYEGGDVTGADWALVDYQQRTNPLKAHVPLTDDRDQLTAAWTAGDYRRTAAWLRALAADVQRETLVFAPPGAAPIDLCPRPVVVAIPNPPEPAMKPVLEDLTLATEKLSGRGFWRYVSWPDTPVIAAGRERLALSGALIALGGMARDDQMLRLAALVDGEQYVQVNGAREERMIAVCRQILEPIGWAVTPRRRLSDPPGDVDVYAVREREQLAVQLKSTLRPETPWEVYKRNDDILDGIEKAVRARAQLGENVTAVVVTDGYRGDYATWRVALERRVPIGTLEDIEAIGRDPAQAFDLLQGRVGFDVEPHGKPPQERTCKLMGWSVRMVDARPESKPAPRGGAPQGAAGVADE